MPHPRQEELFEYALTLPPADRIAWVASKCADDPSLQAQLESLLRAHDEAQEFMNALPRDLVDRKPTREVQVEEKAGDRIGPL